MPKSVIVLLNPSAGRNFPHDIRETIDSALSRIRASFEIIETKPGHIHEQAHDAAAHADLVVAAGGDGTLHAVLQGVVGTPAALGLIPLGTGNDFARTIGLGTSIEKAIDVIDQCEPLETDIVRFETNGGGGWMINVGGIGFDAAVAESINTGFRHLRGTTAYVAAVMKCLITYRTNRVRMTVDDETREVQAMLCAVANARCYGGGMQIAPNALVDDGLLDVVVLEKVNKVEFLLQFPRVFKGTHLTHRKVTSLRGKKVTMDSAVPMSVLADGEIVGTTPVTFEVVPGAIRMVRPS